jgi:hypothetical protein
MDTSVSLWMDTLINKLERQARNRRDYPKGNWDGYSSELSPMLGTKESIGNDISRRERMAEAMYDI